METTPIIAWTHKVAYRWLRAPVVGYVVKLWELSD